MARPKKEHSMHPKAHAHMKKAMHHMEKMEHHIQGESKHQKMGPTKGMAPKPSGKQRYGKSR